MDICWGIDLLRELDFTTCWGEKTVLKIRGQIVPTLEGDEIPQNIEILRQHGPIDVNTGKLAKDHVYAKDIEFIGFDNA